MEIQVVNVPEHRRYEARLDDALAGYSAYNVRPDAIVLTHTEVLPEFEGKGIGSALARGVLDDIRSGGGVVVPLCPFIAAYIRSHDEYLDLIVPRFRAEFDAEAAG